MSYRICTVVGARPQFIKAAVVSRALAAAGLEEVMVHTGQHYDSEMSRVFFEELGIPPPAVNFGVGSGSHAAQTGAMMVMLEEYLLERPDIRWVVAYGDTNSTVAAGLVASKLHRSLAHVEAGLRSFNRRMPEEINRIITDRLSQHLYCPTPTAVQNLQAEGILAGVFMTGDVMLDATRFFAERAEARAPLHALSDAAPHQYYLATVHRAENTDDRERLTSIFAGFGKLDRPVLLPLHPRTRARLKDVDVPANIELMPPVSYLSMLTLVRNARRVLTDSGGLQKEAFWLEVPCITLREETEWVETLDNGWNRLVGADLKAMAVAADAEPDGPPTPFGAASGGTPSERVAAHLVEAAAA